MKKLIKKVMSKTKSFNLVDYSVLKLCIFFFGLWIATVIPVMTEVNPWIYGAVWAALYVYLIWKVLKKD